MVLKSTIDHVRKAFLLASCLFALPLVAEEKAHVGICQRAVENVEMFKNFRSAPAYTAHCENISYEQGLACLKIIQKEYPDLYEKLDKFRQNDSLGNPRTFHYGSVGFFCPATLYFVKVAGDLRKEFGDLSKMHIFEVGGGYGGQCLVLSIAGGFGSYTMLGEGSCMDLAKKYLTYHGVKNVQYSTLGQIDNKLGDNKLGNLVFSDSSFSLLPKDEQDHLCKKLFKGVVNGYLINSFKRDSSYSQAELLNRFLQLNKEGYIAMDESLINMQRRVLVWKEYQSKLPEKHLAEKPENLSAITYDLNDGGLGDHLLSYLHAKWISTQVNLPLIYRPFPLSDAFAFSHLERAENEALWTGEMIVKKWRDFNEQNKNLLFVIPYFPENKRDLETFRPHYPFIATVDWHDPAFRALVRKMLCPQSLPRKMEIPKDHVAVAVHIRHGQGDAAFWWPLKFPPDSYYAQQIKFLAEVYKNRRLYIYVFTDDPQPRQVLEELQKAVENPAIVFDCRTTPPENPLDDFFAMSQFDCLIRAASNFSLTASLLQDYEITVVPTRVRTFADEQRKTLGVDIHFKSRKVESPSLADNFWWLFGL